MNKLLLSDKLKLINDNDISIQIYEILKQDKNFIFTQHKKGLLFDINLLNDITMNNINNLLNKKLVYESYFIDKFDNNVINNSIKRDINILKLKVIQKQV